jgi:hypothetical protein
MAPTPDENPKFICAVFGIEISFESETEFYIMRDGRIICTADHCMNTIWHPS